MQTPLREEAIRRNATMQRARCNAIQIRLVATNDRPQPSNIEVRVADLQRIKGPLDELDVAGERLIALRELELPSYPLILVFREHGQHVRMQINQLLAQ